MQSPNGVLKAAAIAAIAVLLACSAIACGSSGSGAQRAEDSPQGRAAVAAYRSYLEQNSALLVRAIQAMLPEIKNDAITRAQSRYARARVRYGEVAPLASTFGKLNSNINAHAGEVPAGEFRGFHRIEKALWAEHTTVGMPRVTRRLIGDTKELERRFATAHLKANRIVEGANDVLAGISVLALAGKEEPYAHIDLVDIAANIEGVEAAFEAVAPLLAADEALQKKVEAQLEKLYATVGEYGIFARDPEQQRARSPGVSWIIYPDLTAAKLEKIDRQVKALAQLFSEAQGQIEGS